MIVSTSDNISKNNTLQVEQQVLPDHLNVGHDFGHRLRNEMNELRDHHEEVHATGSTPNLVQAPQQVEPVTLPVRRQHDKVLEIWLEKVKPLFLPHDQYSYSDTGFCDAQVNTHSYNHNGEFIL